MTHEIIHDGTKIKENCKCSLFPISFDFELTGSGLHCVDFKEKRQRLEPTNRKELESQSYEISHKGLNSSHDLNDLRNRLVLN